MQHTGVHDTLRQCQEGCLSPHCPLHIVKEINQLFFFLLFASLPSSRKKIETILSTARTVEVGYPTDTQRDLLVTHGPGRVGLVF